MARVLPNPAALGDAMSTPYSSDIERVRSALEYINPCERQTWVTVAMGVKDALQDAGLEVWKNWSRQYDGYNDRDANDVWRSIRPGKTSRATVFYLAWQNGWRDDGTYRTPTPAELALRHRHAVDRARREGVLLSRLRAEAKRKALAIWTAGNAPIGNAYLMRKQVAPTNTLREIDAGIAAQILGYVPSARGEALTGRLLIVPFKIGRELSTVELIDGDGRKCGLAGGAKAGGYWASNQLPDGPSDE